MESKIIRFCKLKMAALQRFLFITTVSGAMWSVSCCAQSRQPIDNYVFETRQPRLALVMGNRNHTDGRVAEIPHALNDARAMAVKLAELGFDTVVREDLSSDDMYNEVNYFASAIRRFAEQGTRPLIVIYFSGHGFNENGRAYIAGSDVNREVPRERSLPIERALSDLARQAIVVLLLDACRTDIRSNVNTVNKDKKWEGAGLGEAGNNYSYKAPFPNETRSVPTVGGKRKYFVGYAALRLGDAALNGVYKSDEYSPFTAGLLETIGSAESSELRIEWRAASRKVYEYTGNRQEPNREGDPGDIFLRLDPNKNLGYLSEWKGILSAGDKGKVEDFIDNNPENPFATAANKWLVEQP